MNGFLQKAEPSDISRHNVKAVRLFRRLKKGAQGWVFVLPTFIIYLVFFILPFIQTIYISFTDWNGIRKVMNWVGLANYVQMVQDQLFWKAISHNVIWVIVGTISPIAISLGLAMALWPRTRGRNLFQAVYFLPQVLSTVVIALIWSRIYHPLIGILNLFLTSIGLGRFTTGWLGDPKWALLSVLVAAIWAYFGFPLTIIIAGLQSINIDLLDAAKIDGANGWQQFIHVILPQLRPVLTMLTSYTLIGGFNVFDIVWVMTGGGPGNGTEVISTLLYRNAFPQNHAAYGSALAVALTVISLIVTIIFIGLREKGD